MTNCVGAGGYKRDDMKWEHEDMGKGMFPPIHSLPSTDNAVTPTVPSSSALPLCGVDMLRASIPF